MAKAKFKIRIEEPCPVPKDRLSKDDLGYYCSVCSKCVVDYRHYSDQQLARAFNKEPEKERCGIFTHDQLHKVYQEKKVKKYGFFSSLLFSGLLLANKNSHAQSEIADDTMITIPVDTVATIQPDSMTSTYIDTTLTGQDSVSISEETYDQEVKIFINNNHEISIDWPRIESMTTLGFMVIEWKEDPPIPFGSIIDSTKGVFTGLAGFFFSKTQGHSNPTKPDAPTNPVRNNDRPLWLESLRHRFRSKKKK